MCLYTVDYSDYSAPIVPMIPVQGPAVQISLLRSKCWAWHQTNCLLNLFKSVKCELHSDFQFESTCWQAHTKGLVWSHYEKSRLWNSNRVLWWQIFTLRFHQRYSYEIFSLSQPQGCERVNYYLRIIHKTGICVCFSLWALLNFIYYLHIIMWEVMITCCV